MCNIPSGTVSGISKCIGHLEKQAAQQHEIAKYLKNIVNNRCKVENEIEDIPLELLRHVDIIGAIRGRVCSDVRRMGLEETAKKYKISAQLINTWSLRKEVSQQLLRKGVSNQEVVLNQELLNQELINQEPLTQETLTQEPLKVSANHEVNEELLPEKRGTYNIYNEEYVTHRECPNVGEVSLNINEQLQSIRKCPKIFNNLNKYENRRLTYDYFKLGDKGSSRKWGLYMTSFRRQAGIKGDAEERNKWLKKKGIRIKEKQKDLMDIGTEKIQKKVSCRLKVNMNGIELEELLQLGLERGIAVAASLYYIDLLDLEFLIKNLCREKWKEMKNNGWYLVPRPYIPTDKWDPQKKLQVVNLFRSQGAVYTSKKFHVACLKITSWDDLYTKYGLPGLLMKTKNYKRHNGDNLHHGGPVGRPPKSTLSILP